MRKFLIILAVIAASAVFCEMYSRFEAVCPAEGTAPTRSILVPSEPARELEYKELSSKLAAQLQSEIDKEAATIKELDALHEKYIQEHEALKTAENEAHANDERCSNADHELVACEARLGDLREKITKLEEERDKLTKEVADLKKPAKKTTVVDTKSHPSTTTTITRQIVPFCPSCQRQQWTTVKGN